MSFPPGRFTSIRVGISASTQSGRSLRLRRTAPHSEELPHSLAPFFYPLFAEKGVSLPVGKRHGFELIRVPIFVNDEKLQAHLRRALDPQRHAFNYEPKPPVARGLQWCVVQFFEVF